MVRAGTFASASGTRIASTRHTVLLVLALLVVSVQAARGRPMAQWPRTLSAPGARSLLYIWILGLQWVWAGYVWFGVRRAGGTLRTLIDEASWTPARWLRYAAVGFAGFIFWLVFQAGLGSILRPSTEHSFAVWRPCCRTRQENACCGWPLR
jgi:hypothetical protein